MDYHIEHMLTDQENHHHIRHPFIVPEGATQLTIDFEYAPKRAGRFANLLTLSVFDPQRERGTGHRGQPRQHVTVSATESSPGYLSGELQPGEWLVMVNVNLINPDSTINYELDIQIGFAETPPADKAAWSPGVTQPRGPGWYRGDLHGHTFHSDGSWGVDGLVNYALSQSLDFVTLTDHNTVSALDEMRSFATDQLLTMGGFELTTFYGHALALGLHEMIDWRVRTGERSMEDIKQEIELQGGLFVIAHPMAPGDPVCTGCHWDYDELLPGTARLVEVWNEHWDSISNNEAAVQLWYTWLNQGHRIYATVGTDIHGQPKPEIEFGFNVVYASALSQSAILDGLRQGHLYLSSGPALEFTATSSSGQTAGIGDALAGETFRLDLQWSQCREGDIVRLIVDGEPEDTLTAGTDGQKSWELTGQHWCVIEIRDAQHNMRALTNPIFLTAPHASA